MSARLDKQQEVAEQKLAISRAKYHGARYSSAFEVLKESNRRARRLPGVEMKAEDSLITPQKRLEKISVARNLRRNFTQAKGMMFQLQLNVVGTGAKVSFHTDDEEWNKAAGFYWNTTWAKRSDARGDMHLFEQTSIAFMTMMREGDILCWFDPVLGKLKWWEADQLVTVSARQFKERAKEEKWVNSDGSLWKQKEGLVIDKEGIVQFYMVTAGRGRTVEKIKNVTFIKADTAKLLTHPWRINQKRGSSDVITAAADLYDIKEMREHELASAKTAATWAMKVKREDSQDFEIGRSDRPETSPEVVQEDLRNYTRFEKVSGGAIEYLEPGEDVESIKNERPSAQIAPFFDHVSGSAGNSLGLPKLYSSLRADGSFSSARAEMNLGEKTFLYFQKLMERKLYDWLVEQVIAWAIVRKFVPKSSTWMDMWTFTHPVQRPIDTTREAKGNVEEVKGGLSTLRRKLGPNWRETMEHLAEEKTMAEGLGLNLSVFPPDKGAGVPGNISALLEDTTRTVVEDALEDSNGGN